MALRNLRMVGIDAPEYSPSLGYPPRDGVQILYPISGYALDEFRDHSELPRISPWRRGGGGGGGEKWNPSAVPRYSQAGTPLGK